MPREPNILHIWGNKESMNLNSMILTNIQSSNYFKNNLYELKTYHEVIDEIYYRVKHLEPWEKGSRRTQGLTGMCGGVRGVGGGGIVSTAFCILYKLYTLKLTRKQVLGLMVHQDSPYIRGLGFMYVRYTQAPNELWDWYEPYLDDLEEIDVKAGGGCIITIGNMLKQWLTRLEWFDTLFPRIPVPIQQDIEFKLRNKYGNNMNDDYIDDIGSGGGGGGGGYNEGINSGRVQSRRTPPPDIVEAVKRSHRSRSKSHSKSRSRSNSSRRSESPEHKKEKKHKRHHKKHKHQSSKGRSKSRERDREHRHRSSHKKSRHKHHRDSSDDKNHKSKSRSRSRSTNRKNRNE